ncbi:acid protease [Backusella circina FSU 941]|nr:acid protease [Backusella circina FSU 941]
MINKHFLIGTLFFALSTSALPGIPDNLGSLKFPSLQDELFKIPDGINPLKIPLQFIAGVPTIRMDIGTPKQNFIAIFDTATPITYIISDKCNSTICENFSDSQKFHAEQSSSNFKFPFQIDLTYLDGSSARLKPELDSVTFAGALTFQRHLIAEAYDIQNAPAVRDLVWAISEEMVIAPIPGILPGKRAGGSDRTSTGAGASGSGSFKKRGFLDFAWILGVDNSLYTGPIYDIPLISLSGLESPFWKMSVTGLQFRNIANSATNGQNFVGSGDSLKGQVFSSSPDLLMPRRLSDQMNRVLGAVFERSTGRWALADCSIRQTGPDMIFQFEGGVTAEISAQQYTSEENGHCYSLINSPVVDTNYLLLGGPFFQSFYIVYEFGARKIGLAQSIANLGKVYKS